ncbi:MAG: helix-turn-helix transcriptional regulator [Saprospiraceae bacterium]|nr:helix-turn-helix transcriptional regulator [Saprospiraceae bacterium]
MSLLKLKELMSEKGITGKEMAEKTGITAQSISNIVNGTHFPKQEILLAIAKTLDVNLPDLFIDTKEQTPNDIITSMEKDLKDLRKFHQ